MGMAFGLVVVCEATIDLPKAKLSLATGFRGGDPEQLRHSPRESRQSSTKIHAEITHPALPHEP